MNTVPSRSSGLGRLAARVALVLLAAVSQLWQVVLGLPTGFDT